MRFENGQDAARIPPADIVTERPWEPFSGAMVVEPVTGKVNEVALRAYTFSRRCMTWGPTAG